MTKEDVTMIGFEIVAYAGDARSKLMIALNKAQNAHNSQTDILAKEAAGEDLEMSFIMIHGQDHLMTTILLKELMKHLIELYKRGGK